MLLARAIAAHHPADLQLAFARMGLPVSAREYLLEKVPGLQVLLTDLSPEEGRFLKEADREQEQPGREEFPSFVAGDFNRRPGTGLLSGRREQFAHLVAAAQQRPDLARLAHALRAVLDLPSAPLAPELGPKRLEFGARTYVMGVVNVTPDSFSDGGLFYHAEGAVAQGRALAEAGADILDIGGESTRPGSAPVPAEEELRRVLPVLRGLRELGVPLSIDTVKSEVAEAALVEGALMVNDISGLSVDERMGEVIAQAKAACCVMHIQGTPETMQKGPRYGDVVAEVLEFLQSAVHRATSAGIGPEKICVDPGIGFGKKLEHNLFLLRRLVELRALKLPILVGTSRKSFLAPFSSGKAPSGRLPATLGSLAALAILGGADIVRVHDVAEAKEAVSLADAIRCASGGGELY